MQLKHLVEAQQLDDELLFSLFDQADRFRQEVKPTFNDKILATIFYEKSTRTRLSFESAMLRLGGKVISVADAAQSSVAKGESLEDTIRVISGYSDLIAMRHNQEGAAKRAANISSVPIINAGDGKGEHPTQALLDVYTIQRELGTLRDLSIVISGDLKYGRTARSLCLLLGRFPGNGITFVPEKGFSMGEDIKQFLRENNTCFEEKTYLNEVLSDADIVYMTRSQKERMVEGESTEIQHIIDSSNLDLISKSSRILHPLPKREEINLPLEVEQTDPRVGYFRQAENGLYVRMALISHLLDSE
jgi:aspartate carbamoyltransferase catalytic subunit